MEYSHKPVRKMDYRLENLDNELILLNPHTTRVLYFNQTASVIWQLCDGTRTITEIVELLSSTYPEAAARIPAQVESTLKTLHDNGAVDLL